MKKPKTIEGTCEKCGKWLKVYPYHHVIENPEHLLGTTGVPKYELVVKKYCFDCWKEEMEKDSRTVDKPEDIEPITTEYEHWIDGIAGDMKPVPQPELPMHKASKLERVRNHLISVSTFDFLRHFIIGFVGVGGTTLATTGNLLYAVVAGSAGGLVEGGRKVWSNSTASKNGGTKNRVLQKLMELVVALIEWWLNKRKEEQK